jgi:hypothetical protein
MQDHPSHRVPSYLLGRRQARTVKSKYLDIVPYRGQRLGFPMNPAVVREVVEHQHSNLHGKAILSVRTSLGINPA